MQAQPACAHGGRPSDARLLIGLAAVRQARLLLRGQLLRHVAARQVWRVAAALRGHTATVRPRNAPGKKKTPHRRAVSPSHLVPVVRRRVLHVVLVAVQLLRALHLRLQLGRLRLLVRLVLGLQRRRLLLLRLLLLLLLLLLVRLRLRLRLGLRLRLRLGLGLRLRLRLRLGLRLRLRRLLRLLLQLQLQRLLLPLLGLLLTRLVRLLGAE
jgi:hypothetical protein